MIIESFKAFNIDCSTLENEVFWMQSFNQSGPVQFLQYFSGCHGHDRPEHLHLKLHCEIVLYKIWVLITKDDSSAFPRKIFWSARRIDDGISTKRWTCHGNSFLPSEGNNIRNWECTLQNSSLGDHAVKKPSFSAAMFDMITFKNSRFSWKWIYSLPEADHHYSWNFSKFFFWTVPNAQWKIMTFWVEQVGSSACISCTDVIGALKLDHHKNDLNSLIFSNFENPYNSF